MADFNPSNAVIRVAWEGLHGIPEEAVDSGKAWDYHELISESLSPEYGTIERPSISAAGQRPVALPGKITGAGEIEVEWNVEDHTHYLAAIQRWTAAPVADNGSYAHTIGPKQTITEFPETLTVEMWRDDDMGHLFKGCRVNSVSFRFEQESTVQGTIGIHPERADYWALADETGTAGITQANPDLPVIRGLPRHDDTYDDWVDDGTKDLWFRVVSTASPNITLACKFNSQPAKSVADFTCVSGVDAFGDPIFTRVEVEDGGGRLLGTKDLPVEIYMPNVSDYATDDEWKHATNRSDITGSATYSSCPPLNEIYCFIYIADDQGSTYTEYCIEGVEVTIEQPVVERRCIGGRYPKQIFERGQRLVGGSINREYLSTALKKRMERARSFALKIEAYTGVEIAGGSGNEYSLTLMMPNCKFSGTVPTVGGQEEMTESYEFTCHPLSSGTYQSDITMIIMNSMSVLTG